MICQLLVSFCSPLECKCACILHSFTCFLCYTVYDAFFSSGFSPHNLLSTSPRRTALAYEIRCMCYCGLFSWSNFNGSQRRSLGYRRPGADCNFTTPESRETPDAPLSPPFLPPLLIAAWAVRSFRPPRYSTDKAIY